jgi:hypothetical protein
VYAAASPPLALQPERGATRTPLRSQVSEGGEVERRDVGERAIAGDLPAHRKGAGQVDGSQATDERRKGERLPVVCTLQPLPRLPCSRSAAPRARPCAHSSVREGRSTGGMPMSASLLDT